MARSFSAARRFTKAAGAAAIAVLIGGGMSAPAAAASPYGNRSNSGTAYLPPAIHVQDVTAAWNEQEKTVTGTFVLISKEKALMGDLRYRLQLLGKLPEPKEGETIIADTAQLFDQMTGVQVLALAPGTEKTVSYAFTPPQVPAGDYRLRVQAITSQGRLLSWSDAAVAITGQLDNPFVRLTPGTIGLAEFPDELIPPMSGPNVAPGGTVVLRATAENTGTSTVTVTPTLAVYEFDIARARIDTPPQPSITLQAGEKKELDLPVTAAQKPEAYQAELTLNDASGRQVSPVAEYRWVVRGASAEIVQVKVEQPAARRGQTATVKVDAVGAADGETKLAARISVELEDKNGLLAPAQETPINLADGVQSVEANLVLERDAAAPLLVRATLTDEQGTVLDKYEYNVPISAEELKSLSPAKKQAAPLSARARLYLAAAAILILASAAAVALRQGWRRRKPRTAIFLALIAAGAAGWYLQPQAPNALGNGIVVLTANGTTLGVPTVEVIVNKPIHNNSQTASRYAPVPVSWTMNWVACRNDGHLAQNRIRLAQTGGKWSDFNGQNTAWQEVYRSGTENAVCTSDYYCQTTRSYEGIVSMSGLATTVANTTLQFQGAWADGNYNPLVQFLDQLNAGASSFTFNSAQEIYTFVKDQPGITWVIPDPRKSGYELHDNDVYNHQTARRKCEESGYPEIANIERQACTDTNKVLGYWNGSAWAIGKCGSGGNQDYVITQLTCGAAMHDDDNYDEKTTGKICALKGYNFVASTTHVDCTGQNIAYWDGSKFITGMCGSGGHKDYAIDKLTCSIPNNAAVNVWINLMPPLSCRAVTTPPRAGAPIILQANDGEPGSSPTYAWSISSNTGSVSGSGETATLTASVPGSYHINIARSSLVNGTARQENGACDIQVQAALPSSPSPLPSSPSPSPLPPSPSPRTECSDELDNDADNHIDSNDLGCIRNGVYDPAINNESALPTAGFTLAPTDTCVGGTVTADASTLSSDSSGHALTYNWTVIGPNNSQPVITGGSQAVMSFRPSLDGVYSVTLLVSNGQQTSQPVTKTITATNHAPSVTLAAQNAGYNKNVTVIASASDPDAAACGDTIDNYTWSLTFKDSDGKAKTVGFNEQGAKITFTAADEGVYTATVVAKDSHGLESAPAKLDIPIKKAAGINPGPIQETE